MRRPFFAGALLLALLLASGAHAADTLRVGKASPTSPAMFPVDVGKAEGIFRKHGLEIEIITFQGGAKLHQGTAAGSIDLGIGAGPELAFVAKGSPELAIANPAGPPLFIAINVPYDSPVRAPQDLRGKKIGVTTVGSLTYWLALELSRQNGWGPEGVTPVAIGSEFASRVAGFRTGAIDASIDNTSFGFQMEEQKIGRLLLPVSSYVGNMSAATIFATNRLMQENPDAIRRFLVGWFETVDFMRHSRAETVRVACGVTGFSQGVQEKEYDLTMPMFNDDGKFDGESLATLKRSFRDLKLLDQDPDMTKLYTEAFLPK